MNKQGVLKCVNKGAPDSCFIVGMNYDYIKPRVNAYVFSESGRKFILSDLLVARNGAIFEEVKL